jgi:hypothetical protein
MKIQTIACDSCAWNLFVNNMKQHKLVNELVSVTFSSPVHTALIAVAAPGCDHGN